MYNFCICAVFKNEGHALKEWVEHYIREGCDHFYLIDNDSTDQPDRILSEFGDKISLRTSSEKHKQSDLYNAFRHDVVHEAQWVAVVDLDEFMYSKTGTISEYLRSQEYHISQILVSWIPFGSSGHLAQPDSIVKNFLRCGRLQIGEKTDVKALLRTSMLSEFRLHMHPMRGGLTITSDNSVIDFLPADERIIQTLRLVDSAKLWINHYQIQSWQYFERVKMVRGDAINPKADVLRDEAYFQLKDQNDLESTLLRDKAMRPPKRFSQDWFSRNIKIWDEFLLPLGPNKRFLEIGSFEGRSACWLLENIPTCTLTCIDTFGESTEETFLYNTREFADRVIVKKGRSEDVLRLESESFDFVYIDGAHDSASVLSDAILVFPRVKRGGYICFDDYLWGNYGIEPTRCPRAAIDSFLLCFGDHIRVLHKKYQVWIQKI